MTSFADLPKQWLIARQPLDHLGGVAHAPFEGWHIQTALHVPVLSLRSADGTDLGRVIGWAILDGMFYREDTDITLAAGDTPEAVHRRMGGRFVLLWRGLEGDVCLREDASGNLPAVCAQDLSAIGATVTALEMLGPLAPNDAAIGLFDFPKNKGFLPFGLTPRQGASRLMPNHVLRLETFTSARVWPDAAFCTRPDMDAAACRLASADCAVRVAEYMRAIVEAQGDSVLYLSGGHDSRMVLAAAVKAGVADRLILHTLTAKGGLDVHIAQTLAASLGRPHAVIVMGGMAPASRADWIKRAGGMIYDAVTDLADTMQSHVPDNHPLSGTGAEIARGSNWRAEDLTGDSLDVTGLLSCLRIPDTPVVRAAAEDWLKGVPETADAAMILDLAKIEQIHACWSGAATYGHPMALPTLHPFSGQRLNETILALPRAYRAEGQSYRDFVAAAAPAFLDIPVNQAQGLARLKFLKHEIKAAIPSSFKRWLKPFR